MAGANLTKGQDPSGVQQGLLLTFKKGVRLGVAYPMGFSPKKRIRVNSSRVLNKGVDPSSHNEGMDRFAFYCHKKYRLSRSDRARLQCPSLGEELWQLIRAVELGQVNCSIKMSSCRKDLQFCVHCRMHHAWYVNEPWFWWIKLWFQIGCGAVPKAQVHSGSPAVPWCGISVAGKLDAWYFQ